MSNLGLKDRDNEPEFRILDSALNAQTPHRKPVSKSEDSLSEAYTFMLSTP